MSEVKYNLIDVSGYGNITVVYEDRMEVANSEHPNWNRIVELAKAKDPAVMEAFDLGATVAKKFERLSERVLVANGHIYFDGEEIDNALTKQVLRFLDEQVEDYKPLVAFFEKVMLNPQEDSRNQLFRFLEAHDITILPDGDFYLYKGVQQRDGVWHSIHSGKAIVNGEVFNGYIPQHLDAVVEMPRGEVAFDPATACHTGLHAGTFAYANSFSNGNVIKVKINPRDVVSVPFDHSDQKVRVCRYTVMSVEKVTEVSKSVYETPEDWDEDEESCENCGETDHYEEDCPDFDDLDDIEDDGDEDEPEPEGHGFEHGQKVRLVSEYWYYSDGVRTNLYGLAKTGETGVVNLHDGSAELTAYNVRIELDDNHRSVYVAPESLEVIEDDEPDTQVGVSPKPWWQRF